MKRAALPCLILLAISTVLHASPPEVCRVQGGGTRTIWGAGFVPGQTEVWGWTAPYDEARVKAAISGTGYAGSALAPITPPTSAAKYTVFDVDPRGTVLAVDFNTNYKGPSFFDAMIGPDVVWVHNPDGYSKPWIVRAAQPWFVYPEKAAPGQRVRLFGRNINAKLIAIKPKSGGPTIFLSGILDGRMAMYEASALIPFDLRPGAYQIYVHNGTCGEAGWGGPIDISVRPAPRPVTKIFSVKDSGAKGNGVADDTAAIRSAVAKAAKSGGGIVYLPPGRYPISKTIWLPSGVTLKGAGMYNSTLCVLDTRPMTYSMPYEAMAKVPYWLNRHSKEAQAAPMLWMWDNSSVSDIGFDDGPGVLNAIFGMHDNCHVERCRMHCPSTVSQAVVVEFGSYGFVLKDCEIEAANGGLFMVHGPHEQVYIGGNKVRSTRLGMDNNLFVRSFDRSIIENNTASDADRNFTSECGHASTYHSVLIGNSWFNNIPRRHNSGENMYESRSSMWRGKVANATANTITVAGSPFADTKAKIATWDTVYDTFVLILDGRGLGQYRRVIAHTPSTLTLEKPWDVIPDDTTYITVGRSVVETLWVDNTEEHTANWTGWWGNCFGNVIDGQILRDGEGIYLWGFEPDKPAPVAFNDVIGSEIIGRGQVKFIGPLVFGNTVRSTEIVDFRYRPSFHITMSWSKGFDPSRRFAVDFGNSNHRIAGLPSTAPLKDWNIIDDNNIYNGPVGIHVSADANHNILRHNVINVDGAQLSDESRSTVVVKE